MAIRVTANGEAREAPAGLSLHEFLVQIGLKPDSVVVERNGEALARSEFDAVTVIDGDTLEIVKAVAGG